MSPPFWLSAYSEAIPPRPPAAVSRTPDPVMSESEHDTISLAELLAAVAARGWQASPRQAKRLREEGLLTCVGQDHPAGLQGSRSHYLPSEIDQLALVLRLGTRERRFDERRVLVAWHGGRVDPDALRASLVTLLEKASNAAKSATVDSEDPGHAAELLIQGPRKTQASPMTKLIRERLGGNQHAIQRVMYTFALMAVDGEVHWSEHDPDSTEEPLTSVIERATATERARDDAVFGDRRLAPSAPPAADTLTELQAAGLFKLHDLSGCMQDASDTAIRQAFEDAHTIADMGLVAEAIGASADDDIGGLGSLLALAPDEYNALETALFVRNALLMRPLVPPQAFDQLHAAIKAARGPMTVFLEMRKAMPDDAAVLNLDLQARLAELPKSQTSRIKRKIGEILDSRPELRAMLEQ